MKKLIILFFIITNIFLMPFLSFNALGDTGTFGSESAGASTYTIEDTILFGRFNMDDISGATGVQISFYVGVKSGPDRAARAGLYDSGGNLVTNGGGNEVTITGTGWFNSAFGTPPSLTANQEYYLGVWCVAASQDCSGAYATSGGSGVYSDTGTYGAMPASVTYNEVDADGITSIHLDYSYTPEAPWENTVPVITPVTPENNSVGYNTSGYLQIWANDSDGHTLNITWFYWDGSYNNFANNNSVACNNTYDVYYSGFNQDCNIYKWKVEVDDGYSNITRNFTFSTYCPAPFVNTPTTIEEITPENNSVGYNTSGYLQIWANDSDGQTLNLTWFYWDGSYNNFANNNSVACNTTYDVYYSGFNSDCTVYKWAVTVDDGYSNNTFNFTFTTLCPWINYAPTIEAAIPENGTCNYNLSGYLQIWANDSNGNLLNITWTSNVSGTWINYGDNNSVACNLTYDIYILDLNTASTTYYFNVTVDDGTNNISRWFTFTTEANVTTNPISISDVYPVNGSLINPTYTYAGFNITGPSLYHVLTFISDDNITFINFNICLNAAGLSFYHTLNNITFYSNRTYYFYFNITDGCNATNTYETVTYNFLTSTYNSDLITAAAESAGEIDNMEDVFEWLTLIFFLGLLAAFFLKLINASKMGKFYEKNFVWPVFIFGVLSWFIVFAAAMFSGTAQYSFIMWIANFLFILLVLLHIIEHILMSTSFIPQQERGRKTGRDYEIFGPGRYNRY